MAVICDACEQVIGDGISKCCRADVWAILRADGDRYECQDCGNLCEIVEVKA